MRFDKDNVRRGMTAISTKGEKLGKVVQCDDETFVVEKGLFFHKDYRLYYEYVTGIRDDQISYALDDSRLAGRDADANIGRAMESHAEGSNGESGRRKEGFAGAVASATSAAGAKAAGAKANLQGKVSEHARGEERREERREEPLRTAEPQRSAQPLHATERLRSAEPGIEARRADERMAQRPRPSAHGLPSEETLERPAPREARVTPLPGPEARASARAEAESEGELRIPLMDEELAVEKVERETGRVRIHKGVRLEEKHITIPVRTEEVVIERLPGREATLSGDGSDAFKEQTLDLPVYGEEVRVTKHAVLREELRVRRTSREEQREAAATLRHEEAEIEDTTPAGKRLGWQEPGMSAAGRDSDAFKKD
jgi:uncharacterized protein (TIGR02271 family)